MKRAVKEMKHIQWQLNHKTHMLQNKDNLDFRYYFQFNNL